MVRVKQRSKAKSPAKTKAQEHDWWAELCQASAIHGMPYLARKDLHWIERIFWLVVIVAAAFYSLSSCYLQYERFRNNPIVYEYEYLFALRDFSFMGVTFCAEYETEEQTNQLISDLWGVNVTGGAPELATYYRQFLYLLNRLQYNNLEELAPYANDSSLAKLNFLEILLKLQQDIMPDPNESPAFFAPAITEMGLCRTTTQLTRYGNPYGKIANLNVTPVSKCGFFNECQQKYKPLDNINTRLFLYIHDVHEVMLPQDRRTEVFEVRAKSSYVLKLLLSSISAESEVRNLPIAYRKCRYRRENNLKYFSPYHPSLCRLECRIDAALALCQCKPYFYAAAPEASICSIKGMLCLAKKNWLEQPCECMPLCQENSYIISEEHEQQPGAMGEQYERTIILKQELPKMGMRRRVVFSTDQLIMSFGGAIGLFLGASFMTIYGLVYLCLYYLVVKCKWTPEFDSERSN